MASTVVGRHAVPMGASVTDWLAGTLGCGLIPWPTRTLVNTGAVAYPPTVLLANRYAVLAVRV